MSVIQRTIWDGTPREEATWWTLYKAQGTAVCRMFSHPTGHELQLELAGEPFLWEVCRDDEEVLACQERWRTGLEEKGWRAVGLAQRASRRFGTTRRRHEA